MISGQVRLCTLVLFVVAFSLSWLSSSSSLASGLSMDSLKPEMSVKEMRTNLKIFLTNVKIRQVPLAKKRSERLLIKLYREERVIKAHMAELEQNLAAVSDKSRRQGMKVLDVRKVNDRVKDQGNDDYDQMNSFQQNLMKVSELTQARIDEWRAELDSVKLEFDEIRAKIDQTKRIIKEPESFIAVPTNYGREEPDDVQEREREILIKDRLNMDYRAKVETGEKEPPYWLMDKW